MRWKSFTVKALVYFTFTVTFAGVFLCVWLRAYEETSASYSAPNGNAEEKHGEQSALSQESNSNPTGDNAQRYQAYAQKWLDPIVILTALLVVGVAVTAYIYWRQLKKMEETVALVGKQGKTMDSQLTSMLEQTIISRIAANAAKESSDVAKQALYVAERPYLDIVGFKVSPIPFEAHHPITYFAKIQNTGRTPAHDVKGAIYLDISSAPLPDPPDYKPMKNLSVSYLGSGSHTAHKRTTPDLDLQPADIEEIEDGRLHVYVYGVETYKDSFTNVVHRLRFCQEYNWQTKRMEVTGFHNDSD